MLGPYTLSPPPPLLIPKLPALIAPIIHERGELGVRHRCPRNRKCFHFDRMRQHFIIEDEMRARVATEQEGASGDLGVSQPFHQRERGRNLFRLSALPAFGWHTFVKNILGYCYARRRIAQRLPCISDCFRMRVFVKERELEKLCVVIPIHIRSCVGCRLFEHAVENPPSLLQGEDERNVGTTAGRAGHNDQCRKMLLPEYINNLSNIQQ